MRKTRKDKCSLLWLEALVIQFNFIYVPKHRKLQSLNGLYNMHSMTPRPSTQLGNTEQTSGRATEEARLSVLSQDIYRPTTTQNVQNVVLLCVS